MISSQHPHPFQTSGVITSPVCFHIFLCHLKHNTVKNIMIETEKEMMATAKK